MKHRLQFQIFGALALSGIICVGCMTLLASLFLGDMHPLPRFARNLGELIVDDLPPTDSPRFEREFRRRAQRLGASMTLWDEKRRELAHVGKRVELPPHMPRRRGFARTERDTIFVHLEDGRFLGVAVEPGLLPPHSAHRFLWSLAFLLFVLLLGSHWAARRIVRRLETLERTVSRFGAGDLSARVELRGNDEIARLGDAFNRNFARIGALLRQQRRMLQSASHELRSPLTRLRMALELATDPDVDAATRERLRSDAGRDIEELDALIGDLLLAGRLSDTELPRDFSSVDLACIVREEAERVRAQCKAESVSVQGNARMLRSLVRNLLENARRYGKDPIEVKLLPQGERVLLVVEDAGDGVPESDRERIFEPFYRREGHREGRDGGVGLGLSLVRTIAEHHGGHVTYVARAEGGSCFEVELPVPS